MNNEPNKIKWRSLGSARERCLTNSAEFTLGSFCISHNRGAGDERRQVVIGNKVPRSGLARAEPVMSFTTAKWENFSAVAH